MSKKSTPTTVNPGSLFGPAPILDGEDRAAYDELLGRTHAAIKPVDVIDEMLMDDIASLEWEILRWRRLKSDLFRECERAALADYLFEHLEYECDLYRKCYANRLAKVLQDKGGQAKHVAQKLAQDCARNSSDAVDEVKEILDDIGMHRDEILKRARADRAQELAQDYAQRKPKAVRLIDKLLAEAGVNVNMLMVQDLPQYLNDIERIDRLTTIAENRRNASLREIDRRRAALGQTLRRSVQEIEDGEFKVIDATPAKGKTQLD